MMGLVGICRRACMVGAVMVWLLATPRFALAVPTISFGSPASSQKVGPTTYEPSFTCSDGSSGCATGSGSCRYLYIDPTVFSSPASITGDGMYLYIADSGNHRIVKRLASDLSFVASVGSSSAGPGDNQFDTPVGITSDGTHLYIADTSNHRIVKRLASDLSFVASIGSFGSGNNQFSGPGGITNDGTYLYIADSANHRIFKRLASDLSFVASIGSYGSGNNQFNAPASITNDGTYLYIADTNNHRIVKRLASDLSFVASIGGWGSPGLFYFPRGITSDGTYLYIADTYNNRIVKRLASDLSFVGSIGGSSGGSGNDEFSYPGGITSDGTYLYVADTENHRVLKRLASNLSFVASAGSFGEVTDLAYTDIDCGERGTDIPQPSFQGNVELYIMAQSEEGGEWGEPAKIGFAYDSAAPSLNVTSPLQGQNYAPHTWAPMFICSDGGLNCATGPDSCGYSYLDPSNFANPDGITSDGTHLYVVDSENHRIVKRLASDLSYVASIGSFGSGNDQFYFPSGITNDGTYLYVADHDNNRVVKRLASDLSFVASIGSFGSGNNQFSGPGGITTDGTYLYVSDAGNNRIVKRLATDLSFVASIGSFGSGNNQFNSPSGITNDGTYLYIADSANHRIFKRLASDLSFVASIGSFGSGNNQFSGPGGITSDGTYLYVSDAGNNRIVKRLATDLSFVAIIGSSGEGSGNDEFSSPLGITTDGTYLYVSDAGNSRIVKRLASELSFVATVGRYGSLSDPSYTSIDCANGGTDIPAPSFDGHAQIQLTAKDLAGNYVVAVPIEFVYDSTPPTATPTAPPTLTSTPTSTSTPTITATMPPILSLTATPTATATPTSTPTPTSPPSLTPTPLPPGNETVTRPPPPSLAIGVPQESARPNPVVVSRQTVRLSGTGTVGHTIEIRVDGIVVGTALVKANNALGIRSTAGVWEFQLPALATGTREIVTVSIDQLGNRSAQSAPIKLVVLDVAPLDFTGNGDSAIATFRRVKDTIRFKTRGSSESRWSNAEITGRYPVPADYDNDGVTDLATVAVLRGKLQWTMKLSSTSQTSTATFGNSGDTLISGCRLEAGQGSSLATFRSERRDLVFRSYNSSTERTVKFSKLTRGDLLGCGDTDGDGKDEILFRVHGVKKGSTAVAAFNTSGDRKLFTGYNKFLRGFVVRYAGTRVPLLAVLGGAHHSGRQVEITTMAGTFAFPLFYISHNATVGTGIFTTETNEQIPGLFWADNRSGMVYRRVFAEGSVTTPLFKLPGGYTLIRPQNIIRTDQS